MKSAQWSAALSSDSVELPIVEAAPPVEDFLRTRTMPWTASRTIASSVPSLTTPAQPGIRREADAALGEASLLPSHAVSSQLRYLSAVVHETLRLKGPAPLALLEAVRDLQLADVYVPAGTPVFAPLRQTTL